MAFCLSSNLQNQRHSYFESFQKIPHFCPISGFVIKIWNIHWCANRVFQSSFCLLSCLQTAISRSWLHFQVLLMSSTAPDSLLGPLIGTCSNGDRSTFITATTTCASEKSNTTSFLWQKSYLIQRVGHKLKPNLLSLNNPLAVIPLSVSQAKSM